MIFARHHLPRAEQDRERREQQRNEQRAVTEEASRRQWRGGIGARPHEHIEAEGYGLQLQRDVRHDADHRDQRHQHREFLVAAIAGADEVGYRRNVVTLADADQLPDQPGPEREQKDGPEIDRQEIPAAAGGTTDSAIKRPGRGVDTESGAVSPGLARRRALRGGAAIAVVRHGEQQRDVGRRDQEQRPALQYRASPDRCAACFPRGRRPEA